MIKRTGWFDRTQCPCPLRHTLSLFVTLICLLKTNNIKNEAFNEMNLLKHYFNKYLGEVLSKSSRDIALEK